MGTQAILCVNIVGGVTVIVCLSVAKVGLKIYSYSTILFCNMYGAVVY